jgi:hypothetical protein
VLQNEELQRIQAELRASEDKYKDLYEFAPIGYFTLEPLGIFWMQISRVLLSWNRASASGE